jgi:hypothetical protein
MPMWLDAQQALSRAKGRLADPAALNTAGMLHRELRRFGD